MFAWIELPREAVQQWRTNPVLRLVWRRPIFLGFLALASFLPLFAGTLLASQLQSAVAKWLGSGWVARLLGTFQSAILDPWLPAVICLIARGYTQTYLKQSDIQILPIVPRQRLWAFLLPTAMLTFLSFVPLLCLKSLWGISPAKTGWLAIALHFLTSLMWIVPLQLYYLAAGFAWLTPQAPTTISRVRPVLMLIALQAIVHLLSFQLVDAFWRSASPPSRGISEVQMALWRMAHDALGLFPRVVIFAAFLIHFLRRAEAALFTPEAVERYEASRR